MAAQCCGAITGAIAVIGLNGSSYKMTNTAVTDLGLELLLTFPLVIVYLRVTEERPGEETRNSEIQIGFAYMAGMSDRRGTLNPAAALGMAVLSNSYDKHWVQWVGPVLGGMIGAFCYQVIIMEFQNNYHECNMLNVTKEDKQNILKQDLSCPVFHQKTSGKSQPRRKKSSSAYNCVPCVPYQQSVEQIKESQEKGGYTCLTCCTQRVTKV